MNKAAWFILFLLAISIMSTGIYNGGYTRTDDIGSVPCLGCLGLDPLAETEFMFESKGEHQQFVLDELDNSVLFLHYRTDVCSACDEMEPVVDELEEEYPQVIFIHMNLDHSTKTEEESFFNYDIKAEGDEITGVPMFVIMTLEEKDGREQPYFKVLYGIHKKEELAGVIDTAIDLYPGGEGSSSTTRRPFVDLFVDQNCVNCPASEEKLLELFEEDQVYFLSYVTDAPGVSGKYGDYLEDIYVEKSGGIKGHPRAQFNGIEDSSLGGDTETVEEYGSIIQSLNDTSAPITLDLSMEKEEGGYRIRYDLESRTQGQYHLRVIVFDRYSPWENIEGDLIPFAFIDIAFNETFTLDEEGVYEDNTLWSGTEKLDLSDLGTDIGVYGIITKDHRVVQLTHILPDTEGIGLSSSNKEVAITPFETKTTDIILTNMDNDTKQVNLTADDIEEWNIELPASVSIGPQETKNISLEVTCPGETSIGDINEIKVEGQVSFKEYLSANIRLTFEVKDDSRKPIISGLRTDPLVPDSEAGNEIEVSILVVDNDEIKDVNISYFFCTESLCGQTYTKEMNKSENRYVATIETVDEEFIYLHIIITAEDMCGNIETTDEYEIVLS